MLKSKILFLATILCTSVAFSQKQWTLKECVDHALEKNITIEQNKLSVEIAKEGVEIAKGNFLPNLNGNTNGSVNFGSGFDPVSQNRVATSFFGGGMGLSSGITIFNGYRNTNTYKQAQLGVESSVLDLKVIENNISLQIVNGYLNVLFAKENLAAARVQAEISKKQIEAAQKSFDAGTIPKGDLLNAQSTAATDAQSVIARENALDLALLTLAQLIQVPNENFDIAPIDVGTPSSQLLYSNSDIIYQKSLTTQPEISRAAIAIENQDYNIKIAKSGFLPSVSGSASLSTNFGFNLKNGLLNQSFFSQLNDNLVYGLGVSVGIPIFNRFQTKNRVDQALINKKIFESRLENEKLTLKQTIEQAFLDVRTALKTYEAAKISLDAQEEAFKNAQQRFNFGALSLFDFELVRTRLVNAQAAMIRSKYDYVFKTKVLQFYAGELELE